MSDLHLPCAVKAISSVLLQQMLGRVPCFTVVFHVHEAYGFPSAFSFPD